MSSEDLPVRRWRPSLLAQMSLWLFDVIFAGAMVETNGEVTIGVVAFAVSSFIVIGAGIVLISKTHIDLYSDRIVLKRMFRPADVIPLETARGVGADRWGLYVRTGLYGPIAQAPMGVGRGVPALRLLGMRSRGDRIGAAIMAHAEAFRALHPDPRPEVVQVVEDLAETLAWSGHLDETAWFEETVEAAGSTDEPTRSAALRDLYGAATGTVGGLDDIYLGTNRPFFDRRLARLATLTDELTDAAGR